MKVYKLLCIIFCSFILSWNVLYSQNIKAIHPASPPLSNSYSPIKKCKHGGQLRVPRGIEKKYFMFNLSGGIDIAGMDASNKEYAKIAYNAGIGLYGIVKNTKTIALGLYFDYFYLTKTKHAAFTEYENLISYQLHDWIIFNTHLSFLGNIKIKNRFAVQFPVNFGPCFIYVPENSICYAKTPINSSTQIIYNKKYIQDLSIGFSTKIGLQIVYALNPHIEFLCGADWNYLRFKIEENINYSSISTIDKSIRQFSLIGFKAGLAFSF